MADASTHPLGRTSGNLAGPRRRTAPRPQLGPLAPDRAHVRTVADPDDVPGAPDGRPTADRDPGGAARRAPPSSALVARERQRRRQSLRTIHLSPVAAVAPPRRAPRGFDEALPQTIDAGELAARAAILEEQPASGRRPSLPIADGFELDLVAHELRLDGRCRPPPAKEFQLLAMLAANPGRAYTRRQLLDRVWGPEQVGRPAHRRRPRPLVPIQDRGRSRTDPVHLVTVRGVGYRLDPPLTEP